MTAEVVRLISPRERIPVAKVLPADIRTALQQAAKETDELLRAKLIHNITERAKRQYPHLFK